MDNFKWNLLDSDTKAKLLRCFALNSSKIDNNVIMNTKNILDNITYTLNNID